MRPRTKVVVDPEGWAVRDKLRPTTEVPRSDVFSIRGKADRFHDTLVIVRTDGSAVALPVGFHARLPTAG